MYCYWINRMRAVSLMLIIILSSIKHHATAEMKFYSGDYGSNQHQTFETNEAKKMWNGFQDWRKGNENVMDNYRTQDIHGDLTAVDKRLWKINNDQGAGNTLGQSSWNNLRNNGWRKREGNWNNLRGLWGKRSGSSWGKLQGSWGRK